MNFAKWFKEQRLARALSQEELAKELGVGISAVKNYENNKNLPQYATIRKMALYFKIEADELIKLTNKGE